MNRIRLAAAAGSVFAVLAANAVEPGKAAPDFALRSIVGENLRLSEYRGEVVLLSFWASWCGDCRAQVEELAELHTRYGDAGVELLSVSLDQTLRQASDTATALKVHYPVLHDATGAVGKLYEVERMPLVVLIDREGVIREVFTGYRRGGSQLVPRVQALLRE